MFDGVSEEDDPDAALRALLARQLDWVASMMVEGDDGPRWAAVMLCRCLSLRWHYEMRHGPADLGFVCVRFNLPRRSL